MFGGLIALAVMVQQVQLQGCVGGCCAAPASVEGTPPSSCCSEKAARLSERASCCDTGVEAADAPAPDGVPPLRATGRCAGGCCITVAFDLELGVPTRDGVVELEVAATAATPVVEGYVARLRPLRHARPFDRGPPRVDRGAALRACTVLLI